MKRSNKPVIRDDRPDILYPNLKSKFKAVVEDITKTSDIPAQPGVYKWRDGEGRVIYVGKAKNLRNRLTNYTCHEHVCDGCACDGGIYNEGDTWRDDDGDDLFAVDGQIHRFQRLDDGCAGFSPCLRK